MIIQNAIREFLLHCSIEKNLSPKTLKAYGTDLRQLSEFMKDKLEVAEISKHDLRDSGFLRIPQASVPQKESCIRQSFIQFSGI